MSGNFSQSRLYAPSQFNEYIALFEGEALSYILAGIYFTIAGTNLYLLLPRKKRYRIIFLYSIIQLMLTTLYIIFALYTSPQRGLGIFYLPGFFGPDALSPWPMIIVDIAYMLNTWTSDAFLLYRCSVVCLWNNYTLALPRFLYLGTIGSSSAWLVVSSLPGAVYTTHTIRVTAICYWILSTTMNIYASCLISMRLWMYRREISQSFGSQHGMFYIDYIAMTLESASLYTVFVILSLLVFAFNSPLKLVFIPMLGLIQAIAPSLIVYRIARGISFEPDEHGSISIRSIPLASTHGIRTIAQLVHQDISDGSGTTQDVSDDNAETA